MAAREEVSLGKLDRRDFVKLSAVGALVASVPGARKALAAPSGGISVWTTVAKLRHAQGASLAWTKTAGTPANHIAIDPSAEYQDILGFGGAFTDATCYTLHRLEAGARKQLFRQLFHPAEMALS